MSENPTGEEVADYSAELLILEDMGVEPEKLERVNSLDAANKLITYYQAKAPKLEDNPKKIMSLKKNMGQPLPPPEPVEGATLGLYDALDPLSGRKGEGLRWNKGARVLLLFNEEHPHGRVF